MKQSLERAGRVPAHEGACSVCRMNYRTPAFLFGKVKRSIGHVVGEEPWRRRHPSSEETR